MYYIYRHIRLDTGKPFYIGYGKKKDNIKFTKFESEYSRAFSKENRNKYWKNIINSTNYEVDILFESDSFEIIMNKEIEFISIYGREDLGKGPLCNFTDGGDGTRGWKMGIIQKENMSKICNDRYKIGWYNRKKKEVYQYTLQGELIKKWDGVIDAENFFNKTKKSRMIAQAARGDLRHAYGFIWSYKKLQKFPTSNTRKDRYKVNQYTKEGNLIKEWKDIYEVLEQNPNYKEGNIHSNLYNINKSAYNFIWKFNKEGN